MIALPALPSSFSFQEAPRARNPCRANAFAIHAKQKRLQLDLQNQAVCSGRMGKAEEVAELVKYLALSPHGGYITGQVLHVDGGMVM